MSKIEQDFFQICPYSYVLCLIKAMLCLIKGLTNYGIIDLLPQCSLILGF